MYPLYVLSHLKKFYKTSTVRTFFSCFTPGLITGPHSADLALRVRSIQEIVRKCTFIWPKTIKHSLILAALGLRRQTQVLGPASCQ